MDLKELIKKLENKEEVTPKDIIESVNSFHNKVYCDLEMSKRNYNQIKDWYTLNKLLGINKEPKISRRCP